ncbi:MAG: MBL fold metallo-hydrolase [Candidatus Micrarchaeota archaeon]
MPFSFDNGLVYRNGSAGFVIDPHSKKNRKMTAIVSHAHSDHFANGHAAAWMTPETQALLLNRHSELKNVKTVSYEKKFNVEDCSVSLHNAGHVLGSSQVLLENGQSVLISSDFNPVDSVLFEAAKPQACDTLIIESTFGLPEYSFPLREAVHEEIGEWIRRQAANNRFVVLAGYSLGKAQELTRIVNDFADTAPLVHETIFEINQTYEKFGVHLGKYIKLEHNLKESGVLILPPSLMDKHLVSALEFGVQKKVVTANSTGWSYRSGFDKIFPLSDHADFAGLMQFVRDCAPKQVYTVHGFARELANAVSRRLKIPCRPLGKQNQLALTEFE